MGTVALDFRFVVFLGEAQIFSLKRGASGNCICTVHPCCNTRHSSPYRSTRHDALISISISINMVNLGNLFSIFAERSSL